MFFSREGEDQNLCFENSQPGCYAENKKEGESRNGEASEETAAAVRVLDGGWGDRERQTNLVYTSEYMEDISSRQLTIE